MCLGIPGQIVSLEGKVAQVDFWGTKKPIRLDILETTVVPGDYILDHLGYAIRKIEPEDVADTVALYETVLNEAIAELELNREIEVELEFADR